MGKRLQMAPSGEYILWAVIPESAKSSFNRAYGPFLSRSAAYSARTALQNNKRMALKEEGYSDAEVEALVNGIEWFTTGLWRKIDADTPAENLEIVPDTAEERAAAAMWNRSGPVVRGARPKWEQVRNDPAWKKSVQSYWMDAQAAVAAINGESTPPAVQTETPDREG